MRDDAADKEVNTTSDAVDEAQRDTDKSEQNGDCDMEEEEAVSADVKKTKKEKNVEEKKEVKVVSSFFGTCGGSVKLRLLYRIND